MIRYLYLTKGMVKKIEIDNSSYYYFTNTILLESYNLTFENTGLHQTFKKINFLNFGKKPKKVLSFLPIHDVYVYFLFLIVHKHIEMTTFQKHKN